MIVFISGGAKSGKSLYAQRLAKKMQTPNKPLYYLATMIPTDNEDEKRISLHQKEREGYGFKTVEAGRDIVAAIDGCDQNGTFLLDSMTALLANEMFQPDGCVEQNAYKKIADDLLEVVNSVNNIVIVSDFIYSDATLYDDLTESYRRGLAYIDKQTTRLSDVVIEACSGNHIIHKGAEIISELAHGIDKRLYNVIGNVFNNSCSKE